jgi:hypothetical protein
MKIFNAIVALFSRFFEPSVELIVRRALALRPRGAVPHDVLVLHSLRAAGHCVQLEWRARDIHPWDCDLPPSRQAEVFSEQALQDTDVALIRLFQRLPEIDQIEFHVLKPLPPDEVILTGVVDRAKVLDPERSPSLRMRLKMLGVHYEMADSHLVPLPYRAWTLIVKNRGDV